MPKLFVLILVLTFSTCNDYNENVDYPVCMQSTIDNYISNYPEPRQQPANITKYLYQSKEVYSFDPGSGFADWLYTIVDNNCEKYVNLVVLQEYKLVMIGIKLSIWK